MWKVRQWLWVAAVSKWTFFKSGTEVFSAGTSHVQHPGQKRGRSGSLIYVPHGVIKRVQSEVANWCHQGTNAQSGEYDLTGL